MTDGGAIGTVVRAATADSDICALTLALGQIPRARRELDGAETELIAAARAAGLSWARIATALGLGSPQAAEQRSLRLAAAAATVPTGVTWLPGAVPDATARPRQTRSHPIRTHRPPPAHYLPGSVASRQLLSGSTNR